MDRVYGWGGMLAVGFLFCSSGSAQSADPMMWSSHQGNSDHTGYVDVALAPTVNLRQRWRLNPVPNGDIPSRSGMAIGYGSVFISTGHFFRTPMNLTAYDLTNGSPRWSVDFGTVYSVNPPALDDSGSVYVVTGNHASDTYMRSYDALTGAFRWRTALSAQWESYLAPTIVADEVATNSGSFGGIASLSRNGSLRFFTAMSQIDRWTPTPWRTYWLAYTNSFQWIDRATGAIAATVTPVQGGANGSVGQAPVVLQDRAFQNVNGRLIGIDLEKRSMALDLPINAVGQVSTDGQFLYLVAAGALSVRTVTGEPVYAVEMPQGSIHPPLIVTRTHVIANAGPGPNSPDRVLIIDRASRTVVRTLSLTGQLALAADTLVVLGADGSVTALDAPDTLFADGLEPR